jgi:pilus assembly protein Flp/PilA
MLLMKTLFSKFIKDESGATAIEYGLIAGIIALSLVSGLGLLGNTINEQFSFLSNKLDSF